MELAVALFASRENVASFSLQNLRARSNKEAKDQTTKNSLESEFSVLRPPCAPGEWWGWPREGDRASSRGAFCLLQTSSGEVGSGQWWARRTRAGPVAAARITRDALGLSSDLAGGSHRPSSG